MKYLRTLTEKSVLKFGRYSDLKVGEVLNRSGGNTYLTWVYYNCSMISFSSRVLDLLYIRKSEQIIKPGKDSNKGTQIIKRKVECVALYSGLSRHVYKNMKKGQGKAKYKSLIEREKLSFSKKSLQAVNQGHY